ncbi:hypothetical protein COX85_03675 [Candidatus Micrarchaeota archaeon CG_4_10_14_0_2_um_filter_55_9]|nr:MAG: hypothetical protein AUJ15_00875 [Candidatus Micrarchaeota archaeon CG1_02_55_41]PIO02486.1 MAG: hypothetical protein COT57_03630 [Candidatus Micrarchaeota archaeon CG09_land_8_20_14_0_10_55_25]PIZ91483.1 MAG: hypothetical protein COX85_03675 [Candidatus Micrarchaeota archaeon CG_4_10_14_0_2_um_filter_55_9]PJD00968.1 MAG: hypothetical protein COU38_03495 [Candidatus Micrarchaeota archaeon CG10_big_fil_rev_8_21_14_0_10_54_18]
MAKEANAIGPWAFLAGIVIALLAAFVTGMDSTILLVLTVLGLIVGILNVGDSEVLKFLVGTIAFIVAGSSLNPIFVIIPGVGIQLAMAMTYLVTFVSPAAAVVAIKAIYDVSKDR